MDIKFPANKNADSLATEDAWTEKRYVLILQLM